MKKNVRMMILLLILFLAGCTADHSLENGDNTEPDVPQQESEDPVENFTFHAEAIFEAMEEFIEPKEGMLDPADFHIENEDQQYDILYANGGHFRDGEEVYWGVWETEYSDWIIDESGEKYKEPLGAKLIREPNDYFQKHIYDRCWEEELERDGYIFAGWIQIDHEPGYDRNVYKATWLKEEDFPVLPEGAWLKAVYSKGVTFTNGEELIWTIYDDWTKEILRRNHSYPIFMPGYLLTDHVDNPEGKNITDSLYLASTQNRYAFSIWYWDDAE